MRYVGFVLAIFRSVQIAIRLDFAPEPAATSRRNSGIDRTGRSRMRGLTMELHRLACRGWPFDCMQANCQRERGLSPQTGKPLMQLWCKMSRVVPVITAGIPDLLRVVRELAASNLVRACVGRYVDLHRDPEVDARPGDVARQELPVQRHHDHDRPRVVEALSRRPHRNGGCYTVHNVGRFA